MGTLIGKMTTNLNQHLGVAVAHQLGDDGQALCDSHFGLSAKQILPCSTFQV